MTRTWQMWSSLGDAHAYLIPSATVKIGLVLRLSLVTRANHLAEPCFSEVSVLCVFECFMRRLSKQLRTKRILAHRCRRNQKFAVVKYKKAQVCSPFSSQRHTQTHYTGKHGTFSNCTPLSDLLPHPKPPLSNMRKPCNLHHRRPGLDCGHSRHFHH
jgi:hypothetical protein